MVKHLKHKFEKALVSTKNVALVFLGVGLTLFVMNISSLLNSKVLVSSQTSYFVSVIASIIIILVSVHLIVHKK